MDYLNEEKRDTKRCAYRRDREKVVHSLEVDKTSFLFLCLHHISYLCHHHRFRITLRATVVLCTHTTHATCSATLHLASFWHMGCSAFMLSMEENKSVRSC